ncbi:hypothetical protein CWR43_00540 [Rhizobium sullae]|uniref:Chloramphenicol phosphotransferase-like protein n=1 Tax=Rhizobium sullae TaxID=50338 RepID=A0A2N0DHF4_RHISU|nr:hypothetical protein CWR43_00540 [Rhizobium sullae]
MELQLDIENAGQIVILNGPPRSGTSSIVKVIQETFDNPWLNLGVDVYVREMTPSRCRLGIGVRPGGEQPDRRVRYSLIRNPLAFRGPQRSAE